jgi:hypothetical protein
MFDGNPAASFALLEIARKKLTVTHHRIAWDLAPMKKALQDNQLPKLYISMYEQGLKLN